jgi:hypothetical protein
VDGYQRMPAEELLCVQRVALELPLLQFLIGAARKGGSCTVCGEEILNGRELPGATGPICRGCAAEPYYGVVIDNVSDRRTIAGWPAARAEPTAEPHRDRLTALPG